MYVCMYVCVMDKTSSNTLADIKMLWLNREASGLLGILYYQRIIYQDSIGRAMSMMVNIK